MTDQTRAVEVAAFQADGVLHGFVVSGRWPETTLEWMKFLVVAVRVASLPGLLPVTTVFSVREELPTNPLPDTVGLVVADGTVVGETSLAPGHYGSRLPAGLIVLHPPSETTPSLPELDEVASGCVLLPGLPHLGLDHRAAWVQADHTGSVSSMVSRAGIDPKDDADTAVLAMLLAA